MKKELVEDYTFLNTLENIQETVTQFYPTASIFLGELGAPSFNSGKSDYKSQVDNAMKAFQRACDALGYQGEIGETISEEIVKAYTPADLILGFIKPQDIKDCNTPLMAALDAHREQVYKDWKKVTTVREGFLTSVKVKQVKFTNIVNKIPAFMITDDFVENVKRVVTEDELMVTRINTDLEYDPEADPRVYPYATLRAFALVMYRGALVLETMVDSPISTVDTENIAKMLGFAAYVALNRFEFEKRIKTKKGKLVNFNEIFKVFPEAKRLVSEFSGFSTTIDEHLKNALYGMYFGNLDSLLKFSGELVKKITTCSAAEEYTNKYKDFVKKLPTMIASPPDATSSDFKILLFVTILIQSYKSESLDKDIWDCSSVDEYNQKYRDSTLEFLLELMEKYGDLDALLSELTGAADVEVAKKVTPRDVFITTVIHSG